MTDAAPNPRRDIDAALDASDHAGALAAARAYWAAAPNASSARFLQTRLDRLWPADRVRDHRVAFLRSFTVEPVLPLLQAEAALAGCRLATYVCEFNAYAQEILNPHSALYGFEPDTVVLAVQARDIAPDLWAHYADLDDETVVERIESVAAELAGLAAQLRSGMAAHILVHTLETPLVPVEGLLGQRRALTQAEAIGAINRRLRERLNALPDVHMLDIEALQARHGRARFLSEKKWATAKLPLSVEALGWLAAEWWRHLSVVALPQAKVLALDLDNTLWGGVLGEEGVTGIALSGEHPGVYFKNFQRAVLDVARRGVILTLVSKNNLDDAMQVFDEHPEMLLRREHFAAMRVNWELKAANLASLAEELNLGLESFVFLDDNPAERDAVRRSLPQVMVPELSDDPSTYAEVLRAIPALERLQSSAEDLERTRFYAQERERREAKANVESVEDFLASLGVEVEIAPVAAMSLARAAQLTQKTNQLNMTTRRYTEAQLRARLEDPRWRGYVLRSSDRFGDNGIVGVALTEVAGDVCEIDTLLLSCRVIGRQIETAFLSFLAAAAREAGCKTLRGWFVPTAKNSPARAIYETAGLAKVASEGASELWSLDLADGDIAAPPWIVLRSAALAMAS